MGSVVYICESCGKARATATVDLGARKGFKVCDRCNLTRPWEED